MEVLILIQLTLIPVVEFQEQAFLLITGSVRSMEISLPFQVVMILS